MHLEDGCTVLKAGVAYVDLAVEAASTQQGLVEHVGTVGGGQHNHAAVVAEAVHLGEQLVERVLALIVGGKVVLAAAGAPYGVDLVDKDDAGSLLLGLAKHVAHAAGTHAHKHLDKVAASHREERHLRLAGHSLGQQRLARAWRTHQQDALGDGAAQVGVLLGVFEKLHNLGHLFFLFFHTGHVGKGDFLALVLVLDVELGTAAAHAEHTAAATAAHAAHHPYPEHDKQHKGQRAQQHARVVAVAGILDLAVELAGLAPLVDVVVHLVARGDAGSHRALHTLLRP